MRSQDNGVSWSDPATVNDTPLDDRDPGIIQTHSGALVVSFVTTLEFEPNPIYADHAATLSPEVREQWLGHWTRRSPDGGRRWELDNQIELMGATNPDLGYPASVQLGDGSIYTVYYQIDRPGEKTCLMGTRWRLG